MTKAIQFIGTQRSGSNLLRLMLNQHPDISAHHPPHILKTFYPFLSNYGDLRNPVNRKILVEDVVNWVKGNPVTWGDLELNVAEMVTSCYSLIDIFEYIYRTKAIEESAGIWCCKSTFNLNYNHDLEKRIKPFYIYLYRDGRDVAASFKKAVVGPKHIYSLATKWRDEQEEALGFLTTLPDFRYEKISYESLLQNPSHVLKALCYKLGIEYVDGMLEYYKSDESERTAQSGEMWQNVTKPILKDNHGKYANILSESEIKMFESICGNLLNDFGYMAHSVPETTFRASEIIEFERLNNLLMASARQNASENDKAHRQAQTRLLDSIRARLALANAS
ncbi:MAG: sulfotransferase [Cyclobacteriaceae bacterium]|nr:sulfotransferase [Cyclobacteriaceae bacterium]